MAIGYLTDLRDAPGRSDRLAEHYDEEIKILKLADEPGYKSVFIPQNRGLDEGYSPAPLNSLNAFARETKRIRLGTEILQLTLTQPRRVVEEACLVDNFSHGRMTLGVGAGQGDVEFKAFGRSLDN